jgi:hypothetical protein
MWGFISASSSSITRLDEVADKFLGMVSLWSREHTQNLSAMNTAAFATRSCFPSSLTSQHNSLQSFISDSQAHLAESLYLYQYIPSARLYHIYSILFYFLIVKKTKKKLSDTFFKSFARFYAL